MESKNGGTRRRIINNGKYQIRERAHSDPLIGEEKQRFRENNPLTER